MSLGRFVGKVAIISGGTSGIGLATAKRLGQEGCKVVVSSRRQAKVDEAVRTLTEDGIEASGISGNQSSPEDRKKLIQLACENYGGVDALFISAGVNPHMGSIVTATEKQFEKAFNTNVKSTFRFIQEIVPYFSERGGGSVVTNATAGSYGLFATSIAKDLQLYVVSKQTLISMTQSVARECFNKNVRVNCVAPGGVDTPFMKGGLHMDNLQTYWDIYGVKSFEDEPAVRIAQPPEIAAVVAFLLSEDASYVSGNCIIASGGYSLTRNL